MAGIDDTWDVSHFDLTSPGHEAECPSCAGYLHSYASSCYGCDFDRGSAYLELLEQWRVVTNAPVPELLRSEYLAGAAGDMSLLAGDFTEPEIRKRLWFAFRGRFEDVMAPWPQFSPNLNYLGGLQSAPHGEYVRFWYTGGEIVLDGERSRSRLAAIKPASVLAVAPYGNLDEVLGGRTFGFIAGGAMVLQPMQPTEGGALKIVFADDGPWRLAAIGNRTGLTDKRYPFDAYKSISQLIGWFCRNEAVLSEWQLGPSAYARSLGFDDVPELESDAVPDQQLDDLKICPDCAETVKSAARICRWCRHEFWAQSGPS